MSNRIFGEDRSVTRRQRLAGVGRGRLVSGIHRILRPRVWLKSKKSQVSVATSTHSKNEDLLNFFQTPAHQKSFLLRWCINALGVLRRGSKYTEIDRKSLEVLTPIKGKLELVMKKNLTPVDVRECDQSTASFQTLSMNLDTPESTVDFILRLWEFSLLYDSGITVCWTFDRSNLRVDSSGFVPNKVSLVPVNHVDLPLENLLPVQIQQYRTDTHFPSIEGLWSVFYGWIGWVASCGRSIDGVVLPHPIFPRLYVDSESGPKYVQLRADHGWSVSRVFVTLFEEGGCTTSGYLAGKGETAIFGPSGLVTSGQL
jgi:hypothetical protein